MVQAAGMMFASAKRSDASDVGHVDDPAGRCKIKNTLNTRMLSELCPCAATKQHPMMTLNFDNDLR